MPQMLKGLADSAGIAVYTASHTPGGISVGDIAQGNQAHAYNPAVYALIRTKKWDFVVIQDNQGRFVRDSAQFPTTSLVKAGHIKLMDSVKANNSCAKIILFGGWAWKNGMPPYGNTGIECIQRILRNYVVLNDTMKEVIAPIGEAWIKAVNYLPSVDLWDADGAHPSYTGSYLTASVIFSTIFNLPAKNLNYNGTLTPSTAYSLRAFGDSSVFNATFHSKYNLGGVQNIGIQQSGGQLSVPAAFATYRWFENGVDVGNAASLNAVAGNSYMALLKENDGCYIKTCSYVYLPTALAEKEPDGEIWLYPNPVSGGHLTVRSPDEAWLQRAELFNAAGARQAVAIEKANGEWRISTGGLKSGCYLLLLRSESRSYCKKIMVNND